MSAEATINMDDIYPSQSEIHGSNPIATKCKPEYNDKISDIDNIMANMEHYLIKTNTVNANILHESFGSSDCTYFAKVYNDLKIALGNLDTQIVGNINAGKWEKCNGNCFTILTKYVKQEINSTAYMMRLFAASTIGAGWNTIKLDFIIADNEKITGEWENDKQKVTMHYAPKEIEGTEQKYAPKHRLIMGFGPSASGKTYCANNVITLMNKVEDGFPDLFLSIDGGIYRECSVMYQLILKALQEITVLKGLKNLVYAGFHITPSIFDSGKIKTRVMEYLKLQKTKFSLYVPETLGKCMSLRKIAGFDTTCRSIYKDYIEYTQDNTWIGLMIWQHKTGEECDKDKEYKCKGCKESGETREIMEGKQYSSSAWENSYQYGRIAAQSAATYRFIIHNTGGREHDDKFNIITFEDYSTSNNDKIAEQVKLLHWKYENKNQPIVNVDSYPSKKDIIQNNIEYAKQLVIVINTIMQKGVIENFKSSGGGVEDKTPYEIRRQNMVTNSSDVSSDVSSVVSSDVSSDVSSVINKDTMSLNSTFGGNDKSNLDNVHIQMQKKIPRNMKKFYEDRWIDFKAEFKDQYEKKEPEITTILVDFSEFIKTYLETQTIKLAEYQLIEMSLTILTKINETANKAKSQEDAKIKTLLEIAFAIAFPQKSLSFEFNIPPILPEPLKRIGPLEIKTNVIVPAPESTGKVISVEEQKRNIKDIITPVYTKENRFVPKYYETKLAPTGNNEELKQQIIALNEKVIDAKNKIT